METALASMFTAMLNNAIKDGVEYLAKNPQAVEEFMKSFSSFGCHTASDVAQDALDAYDAGHLTREQALQIVEICLQKKHGPTVDIKSKRVQLEQLFN
jgi:tagatose-1,6-bisphosphate aldolase